MINTIQRVYESYGFEPLETPAVEFVETLGKFLPESDQPDAGIFSFNPENQWLALRYDLTAPLSRIVAMYKELPKPFRRYQVGPVWRLEKPGPGRYREFYQFDIDTVGTGLIAADAEICMILCDSFEALGFECGEYIVKSNNRKIVDGIIESALKSSSVDNYKNQICKWANAKFEKSNETYDTSNVTPQLEHQYKLDIIRCLDKQDRVGLDGVIMLLKTGRKDETSDFKSGCFLDDKQISLITDFLKLDCESRSNFLKGASNLEMSEIGKEGLRELEEFDKFLTDSGYNDDKIRFDPNVVRGLDYYTGPVYEALLTIDALDEKGRRIQFGSIGGGGRYDNLVERFTGQKIMAAGASIGIDRLLVAFKERIKEQYKTATSVLVTVMDRPRLAEYQKIAAELRQADISTELYIGKKGIGVQTKYADKRGITVAVIAGEDEFNNNEVTLKDLRLGSKLATEITDRDKWRIDQPAQIQISRDKLIEGVKDILNRYK
jgi:histidyl-tRNA synthetase